MVCVLKNRNFNTILVSAHPAESTRLCKTSRTLRLRGESATILQFVSILRMNLGWLPTQLPSTDPTVQGPYMISLHWLCVPVNMHVIGTQPPPIPISTTVCIDESKLYAQMSQTWWNTLCAHTSQFWVRKWILDHNDNNNNIDNIHNNMIIYYYTSVLPQPSRCQNIEGARFSVHPYLKMDIGV